MSDPAASADSAASPEQSQPLGALPFATPPVPAAADAVRRASSPERRQRRKRKKQIGRLQKRGARWLLIGIFLVVGLFALVLVFRLIDYNAARKAKAAAQQTSLLTGSREQRIANG